MERRLLLVFALTFLVILASQTLLKKYFTQAPEPQKPAQTQPAPAAANPPSPPAQVEAPPPKAAAPGKQASTEVQTVIENDLYRITFSNRGGQVQSWILKKYDDDQRKPLELVNQAAAAKYGHPLSLWTYDETLRNKLNSALYVASSEGTQTAPADLTFEYSDQDVVVRKSFHFDDSYVLKIETSVLYRGSAVSAFPAWPAGFGDELSPAAYAAAHVEYQNGSNVERLAIKSVSGGNTLRGPFQWAGVTDQYFAAVFLPEDPENAALVTFRNPLDIPKDWQKPNPQETIKADVLGAGVADVRGRTVQRMYVGPKALQVLESVPVPTLAGAPPDLRGLVNFGFFGIIARPLFLWLKWTYSTLVSNWGWAIAIQTFIINIALLPLRITQMKSALKMQKVAPQMKAIQEKYKKYTMRDPRKQDMQKEMSELYKREGVHPASGCLPMLIQMPFLFAYYSMLGAALDLRHAQWLWIRDLSSPDPWHLLPVGIIITMLFMQRLTPQAGMDPAQQKMMNVMMPVMLGVISWNLAAGLCLYWSEGNLIAIVQQAIMSRTKLGREMREMMEKRARKKDK